MVFVEDIAVSGEYVEKLKDKHFVIIAKPFYETYKNPDTEEELRRLCLKVELSDKSQLNYYPNKTSIKTLVNMFGFEMDNWLGKSCNFFTQKQSAFGKQLVVLFIEEQEVKK